MVQQTVLESGEFKEFAGDVRIKVDEWFATHRPALQGVNEQTKPQELTAQIGDDLLTRFKDVPLLDEYDVYEQLMTFWHDLMHDDVFLLMNDGWVDAAKPRKTIEDKDRKLSETPDLVIGTGHGATKYKTDLNPPALIMARYLADEHAKVDELNLAADEATRAVEEYAEEHAVEDGPLAEAMDDGKISKALTTARLRQAKSEGYDPDEVKALEHLIKLYAAEAESKKLAAESEPLPLTASPLRQVYVAAMAVVAHHRAVGIGARGQVRAGRPLVASLVRELDCRAGPHSGRKNDRSARSEDCDAKGSSLHCVLL